MMQIISIKKEGNFLKFSLIEKSFTTFKINQLEIVDLAKEEPEQRILKIIEKFLKPDAFWLVGLSSLSIIEKLLPFPRISWMKIRKLLPFQLEALFPYNLDRFELKKSYSQTKKEKIVTFFAIEKTYLFSTVEDLLKNQIEPNYAVLDSLGLKELLKEKEFKEKGIYLHLNFKELILIVYDNHQIKHKIVLEGGYETFIQDNCQKEFKKTNLYSQLILQLALLQEKEQQIFILSGFFTEITNIEKNFFEAKFLYNDKSKALFAQEIGNTLAFIHSKKSSIDLSFLNLPKKNLSIVKNNIIFKKWLFSFLLFFSLTAFSLSIYTKNKVENCLGMEKIFNRQSLFNVNKILQQLVYQAEIAPTILDLQNQPISIEQFIELISDPIKQNQSILKGFSYKVLKHPTFKSPLSTYIIKVELQIEGHNSSVVQLTKDLKKIKQVDTKKGIKMEKIKNEYKVELFLK